MERVLAGLPMLGNPARTFECGVGLLGPGFASVSLILTATLTAAGLTNSLNRLEPS
jgi:hypothetical protein